MAKKSAARKAPTAEQLNEHAEQNAPAKTTVEKSRNTVTVGCKIPNGLILKILREEEYDEPVMGGGTRTRKRWVETGEQVTVHGPATPFGQSPKCLVVGGYAMTTGVPVDFWRAWMEQNKNLDLVKARMIFAQEKEDSAEAQAKDQRSLRSNMEPLDTGRRMENGVSVPRDPRYPRSLRKGVADIEDGDRK